MYVPEPFAADEAAALALLKARPFGALVTLAEGAPVAVQVPFMAKGEPLRLLGHVARANPIWRTGGGAGLMIVQGADAYVSPSLYPSKADHGRVVPTWNYEAVHAHGMIEWFEDRARLLALVEAQTDRFEADRERPWAVADAPADYMEGMLRAIVGFELRVERLEIARKLSQNRTAADRDGVEAGLSAAATPSERAVAAAMRR
jgi:transcriptional regulator